MRPAGIALGAATVLSACVATGPEARRNAYIDCARDQGVPVERGTIRIRTQAHLDALDACEAIPR